MNKEIKYCEICGVSSKDKIVYNNAQFGKCLCQKHLSQLKRFGKVKDANQRGVFDPNEIRSFENFAEIDTYDQYGNVIETYKIDCEDIGIALNYKWRTVYKGSKPYLVTGNQKSSKEYFHRLIIGNPANKEIDHISGDSHDNRKQNLRIVLQCENAINKQKKIDNTSGIRGISFNKKEQRWQCDFSYMKHRLYFKKFDRIEQAVYLRYLCEITFLKDFRNTSNDTLIFEYINKLSDMEKSDIEKYFNTKTNTSKEGV